MYNNKYLIHLYKYTIIMLNISKNQYRTVYFFPIIIPYIGI